MMKKNMKKPSFIKRTVCIILIIGCIITGVYSYYGGIGTGKCANVNEFEKYAVTVENLSIRRLKKIDKLPFGYYNISNRVVTNGGYGGKNR